MMDEQKARKQADMLADGLRTAMNIPSANDVPSTNFPGVSNVQQPSVNNISENLMREMADTNKRMLSALESITHPPRTPVPALPPATPTPTPPTGTAKTDAEQALDLLASRFSNGCVGKQQMSDLLAAVHITPPTVADGSVDKKKALVMVAEKIAALSSYF